MLDIDDCAARSTVHGRYGGYDLKDSHSLVGGLNQADIASDVRHFARSKRLSGTTSTTELLTRSDFSAMLEQTAA
jgi:hypothetical protein